MILDKDNFDHEVPWGFKEETGYWEIKLDLSKYLNKSQLNNYTIILVELFFKAFSSICQPVETRYDLMIYDQSGELTAIQEGDTLRIDSKSCDELIDKLRDAFNKPLESFISTLFLDCDLIVLFPADNDLKKRWIKRAGTFYIGYVMEPNDENKLVVVEGSISFLTKIDVWAERTQNSHTLLWQDNRSFAKLNEPLLEASLRSWELLVGQSIIEWGSGFYKNQIDRYGFKKNDN
jgi:hypothetical protein